MTVLKSWWARLGAVLSGLAFAVLLPAAAWASTGPGEVVIEAARRRRGGGGILFGLCCLVVVGVVVVVLLLLMRTRRSGRR